MNITFARGRVALLVLSLAGLVSSSKAIDQSYYAGTSVGFGFAHYDDFSTAQWRGNTSNNGPTFSLFGGWKPAQLPNVFLEAGYQNFGQLDYNGTWYGVPDRGNYHAQGLSFSAGYAHPVQRGLTVSGRAGFGPTFFRDHEVYGNVPQTDDHWTLWNFTIGVGAAYEIAPGWKATASYDHFFHSSSRIGRLSLGAVYEFKAGGLKIPGLTSNRKTKQSSRQ